MKRAWLYCTFDFTSDDPDDWAAHYVGEVHDEGSLRDLIAAHCKTYGDGHAASIHLIVEGSPEHAEVGDDEDFPYFLPDSFHPRVGAVS